MRIEIFIDPKLYIDPSTPFWSGDCMEQPGLPRSIIPVQSGRPAALQLRKASASQLPGSPPL